MARATTAATVPPTLAQEYDPAVPVALLEPHPRNVNEGDVGAIAGVMEELGFFGACLVQKDSNRIIAGKHRWLAAQTEGKTDVPVLWADVDDDTALRIMLADNRTARLGLDDDRALAELLVELAEQTERRLLGTGYDGEALDDLLADLRRLDGPAIADPGPSEPPDEPVTRPGDLIVLGDHRLLCGDATDPGAYAILLEGAKAQLCLTDPPYGVGIDYGDHFSDDEATVAALINGFVPLAREHSERVLITSGHRCMWLYPRTDWVLTWCEPAGVGRGPWGFNCAQPVLAFGKDPYLAEGLGSRPDTFVGKGEGPSADNHPVAKPLTVWCWLMERGSVRRGDLVVDCFAGSGTTIIAAEQLGRRAAMIELSPGYCDVIVGRWEKATGNTAKRP